MTKDEYRSRVTTITRLHGWPHSDYINIRTSNMGIILNALERGSIHQYHTVIIQIKELNSTVTPWLENIINKSLDFSAWHPTGVDVAEVAITVAESWEKEMH